VETSIRFRDLTVAEFVDRLSSAEPVPGGGSAAAIAGSLAAALVSMVASLSEGKPKYAEHAALHAEAIASGRALAQRFLDLADDDAAAYAAFGMAMKMPRDTDEEREARAAAIRQAAHTAAQPPFRIVSACLDAVAMAEALVGRSNRAAASDLEVAALLSIAAARSAAANVYVNLPAIGDEAVSAELFARTEQLADEVDRIADRTRELVRSGATRQPLPAPGG
jgi:glutamate formiminotransferase/formiminotetrahydrofolate cyclodeaminase